jgi:dodecin
MALNIRPYILNYQRLIKHQLQLILSGAKAYRRQYYFSPSKIKIMSVIKVLELMARSTKSWEDAAQQAVDEASKTLKNIRSVYIQDQSAVVEKNKIVEYRITAKLSFEIEHDNGKSKSKK